MDTAKIQVQGPCKYYGRKILRMTFDSVRVVNNICLCWLDHVVWVEENIPAKWVSNVVFSRCRRKGQPCLGCIYKSKKIF